MDVKCADCRGTGKIINSKCPNCNGNLMYDIEPAEFLRQNRMRLSRIYQNWKESDILPLIDFTIL